MTDLTIDVQELYEMMEKGEKVLLLDVREENEFQFCKISGSLNVPLTLLVQSLDKVDTGQFVVTVCHHGHRSLKAALILKEFGVQNVKSLSGGVDAWSTHIDPTVKRY